MPFFEINFSVVTTSHLYALHCENTNCSKITVNAIDSTLYVGWYATVHFAADGNPLVTYMDNENRAIKIAHCLDPACSLPATFNNVTSFAEKVQSLSSVISLDGNLILLITSLQTGNLVTAHCLDLLCTQMELYNVIGYIGNETAIAYTGILGTVYIVAPGVVYTCQDTACSSVYSVLLPLNGSYAVVSDITGYPTIAVITNLALSLIACGSEDCKVNAVRDNLSPRENQTIFFVDGTVGANGYPLFTTVSFTAETTLEVSVFTCGNHLCTLWQN